MTAKDILSKFSIFLFSVSIAFLIGEIVLRMLGHLPLPIEKIDTVTEPRVAYSQKYDRLGHVNVTGQFMLTSPDGHSSISTHGADTHRITQPLDLEENGRSRKEIWIFGCSYTYGQGLSDHETYPWLLQEKFPEFKIVNFGVMGCGTLQSFIQFEEALRATPKPKCVIVAYASFHDERNVFSRSCRKLFRKASQLTRLHPYARIDHRGNLNYFMTRVAYQGFPFMRHSALIHFIERVYNKIEFYFYQSNKVSRLILNNFYDLARKNDIEFIVAGIDNRSIRTLRYLNRHGILTVDISVDLTASENHFSYDQYHPNAQANQLYAQKLAIFLKQNNLRYTAVPFNSK